MRLLPLNTHTPIGLDIGNQGIHAMQLLRGSNGWHVTAVISLPREGAAATPEVPELQRIRSALSRQGFVGRRVVTAAPAGLVVSAVLELPPRDSGAPIEAIAANELARIHQHDPQEMEVGSWDLPAPSRAGAPVMAVGCAHIDTNPLLDTYQAAGFNVIALDTNMLAIARAVGPTLKDPQNISAVVDMGWSGTRLFMMHQGTVVYERRLSEFGFRSIHETLADRSEMDDEVAEMLIRQVGLGAPPSEELASLAATTGVSGLITSLTDKLVPEIRASFSYAEHRYPEAGGTELVLVGGGAAVPGVSDRMADGAGTETRVFNPSFRAGGLAQSEGPTQNPQVAGAMGLAMFGAP